MGEGQKVLLKTDALLFVPYRVQKQQTTILTGSSTIDSFTKVSPSERRNDRVVYGPYGAQETGFVRSAPITVHYLNNRPFLTVTSVQRVLEISHWGNLAVEEHYEMKHAGAQLTGGFHRIDYQRNPAHLAPSSFHTIVAKLPPSAADIYYRDRIGNISTSTVRVSGDRKHLDLELKPRFPLFGGWKTQFYMGYNLPVSQFLSRGTKAQSTRYQLKAKFGSPFQIANVDDMTVRVIIPEGASNIKVHLPFEVDEESREITKTYLDIAGRPVVVLRKRNVIRDHDQYFTVTYDFPESAILQEPLMVMGGLFAFCLFVMVYVRFDLTIGKTKAHRIEEKRERAEELAEQFVIQQNERNKLYKTLERVIESSDSQRMQSIHVETREKRAQIEKFVRESIIAPLNRLDKKIADKVQAVEDKEKSKFAVVDSLVKSKSEAATGGRGGRSKMPQIGELKKKYEQLTDEIMDLLDEISA